MIGLARGTVQLLPYLPEWLVLFTQEAALLRSTMGESAVRIEHIGSTAIEGMCAKPIIDLVVIVNELDAADVWIPILGSLGYEHRPNNGVPDRLFFAKGPHSRRTHHLSLTEATSEFLVEKLLFRDYLKTHRDAFDEYLTLKQKLAAQHADDRPSYTAGKLAFVERILFLAKQDAAPAGIKLEKV